MSLFRFNVLEKLEKSLRIAAVLTFACFAVVNSSVAAEPYRFYRSFSDCLGEETVPADLAGAAGRAGEDTAGEGAPGGGAVEEGASRIELEEPDPGQAPR